MLDYTLHGKTPVKDNIRDVERRVHVVDSYSAADVTLSLRDVFQQLAKQGQPVSEYQRSFDLAFSFDLDDLWKVDATLSRIPISCLENSLSDAQNVLDQYWEYCKPKRQLLTRIYDRLQDQATLGAIRDCYKTEHSPAWALQKREKGLVDLIPLTMSRFSDDILPEIFVDYSSDTFADIARVREKELQVKIYLQTHLAKAREAFSSPFGEGRLISLVVEFESRMNSFAPYSLPVSPYFKRRETTEERYQRDEAVRQIVAGRCEEIITDLKKDDRMAKMRVEGKLVDYVLSATNPERNFITRFDKPLVLVKHP